MAKIWALFGDENNYDQPANPLVAWWLVKPPLETVAMAMGLKFPGVQDQDTIDIVNVWSGKSHERLINNTHYRLEEISEGILSKQGD